MKIWKKMLSVLMAVAMVMVMAVPALAEDTTPTTYTITINNATEGHTYEAYQIFTGDLSGNVLSNIQWGSGVTDTGKDTLGTAATRAKTLGDAEEQVKAEAAAAFAKEVATYLQNPTQSGSYNSESKSYTITNLQPGYYLVKDKDTTLDGADDAYTAYIMEVVKDVKVTPKSEKPTLTKEIKHNEFDGSENAWGVVGDNQIGDTVEFRTITTVPDVSNYSTYTYVIHDTMSAGLTSNVIDGDKSGVTIKVNDAETPLDQKYYTVTANGNTFSVTVDILQAIADGEMKADDKLYTYYTGVLNKDALIYNDGKQDNTAYLEYSNNPNGEGTGKTPDKTVYDWTFKMEINKVDGTSKAGLDNVEFALSTDSTRTEQTQFIQLIDNNDGTYTVAPKDYAGETTTTIKTTTIGSVKGKAIIKGLDDEKDYYLYETKALDGYNSLDGSVGVKITAGYDDTGANYTAVKINGNDGVTTTIENNKGSTLPSTGGRGTRLFYIIGGVIVVAAAVLLIAKKRMKGNS